MRLWGIGQRRWLWMLLLWLGFSSAQAAVTEFVAGMSASGTSSFDTGTCVTNGTTYTPGKDVCKDDNVIRSFDYATYRVGYTLTPPRHQGYPHFKDWGSYFTAYLCGAGQSESGLF